MDQAVIDKLPSLVGFKPEEGSPLNEEEIFLKEQHETTNANFEGYTLCDWHAKPEYEIRQFTHLYTLEGKKEIDLDQRILDRIALYDEAIQLQDRLCSMKKENIRWIQMYDLAAPWALSGLKIALLTDDEVAHLTVEEINGMSYRQLRLLTIRARSVEPGKVPAEPITAENFAKLTVAELRSLPKETLNKFLPEFLCRSPQAVNTSTTR